MSLEHHTSAKEIWNYLEKRYLQPSGALEYSLLQNLHGIQQDEMSIEEFYWLFTRTTRQLASMVPKSSPGCTSCAAKEKHDEQMLMFRFVMGLRQEFELCRSQLLGRVPLPTLDETLGALIADETRLRSLAASHTTPLTHSGVLASQQRGHVRGPSPSSGVICSHCKKKWIHC